MSCLDLSWHRMCYVLWISDVVLAVVSVVVGHLTAPSFVPAADVVPVHETFAS